MSNTYSTLAILQFVTSEKVAVAAISVTADDSVISGAWVLPVEDSTKIELVLSNRRILRINKTQPEIDLIANLHLKEINFPDFFAEARADVKAAIDIYEGFKALNPKKRKGLVKPKFFDWPIDIDLSKSISLLEENGLQGVIQGTDPEFQDVLTAARLTKFYIDKWRSDENERSSRKYVDGVQAITTILPAVWSS